MQNQEQDRKAQLMQSCANALCYINTGRSCAPTAWLRQGCVYQSKKLKHFSLAIAQRRPRGDPISDQELHQNLPELAPRPGECARTASGNADFSQRRAPVSFALGTLSVLSLRWRSHQSKGRGLTGVRPHGLMSLNRDNAKPHGLRFARQSEILKTHNRAKPCEA